MRNLLGFLLFLAAAASARTDTAATGNPAILGGVWQANLWCTTPGILDQSCLQNAVNNIGTGGPTSPNGGHMGVIVLPPGTYRWSSTVIIPAGTQVEIRGAGLESTWGTVLQATSSLGTSPFFQVNANSTTVDGVVFFGYPYNTSTAIQLGSSKVPAFDSRIFHNWFYGIYKAVNMVNYGGGHFFNNDCDAASTYCFVSIAVSGTGAANNLLIQNNRCYGLGSCIYLDGTGTTLTGTNPNYGTITVVGNECDQTDNPNLACFTFNNYWHINLSGNTFRQNIQDDIRITNAGDVNITGTSSANPGRNVLFLNSISGLTLNGSSVRNCNIRKNSGTTGAVVADNLANSVISGVNATADESMNLCTHSIYVGAGSSGTVVVGNNVIAQQHGDYEILDTSAVVITPALAQFGESSGANLVVQGNKGTNSGDSVNTITSDCVGMRVQSLAAGNNGFCLPDSATGTRFDHVPQVGSDPLPVIKGSDSTGLVCWKTTGGLGTCVAGTFPNCTKCD
jgi:hypothetical protein